MITAVPLGSGQDCWAYCTEYRTKRKRQAFATQGLIARKWHTTELGRAHIYIRVFVVSRELMLISHQNRTEQLQETLRQKMRNEDNWREKVMRDVQLAPF